MAWSHPPRHEETQSLADDSLRMGIVRAQKTRLPTPYTEANERTVLVVGGGVAGLTAALGAARAGARAVLVERTPRLGGYAARLWKEFPKHPPYRDPEAPAVDALVGEVSSQAGIEVLTGAEVQSISARTVQVAISATARSGA